MFKALFRHAPPGSRRHRFARWWRSYVGSIAFVALLLVAAIGFARIENARYDGCVGGNLLREGLRSAELQNIAQIRATDPSLFPNIAPAVFQKLKKEAIERAVEHITVNYADRACGTRVDLPLTGAVVTFPP